MTPEEKAEKCSIEQLECQCPACGEETMWHFNKSAYLAGYHAALESDEVRGLVEALETYVDLEAFEVPGDWNYFKQGGSPEFSELQPVDFELVKESLTQFEKARGGK